MLAARPLTACVNLDLAEGAAGFEVEQALKK
jgi:hypothetical protein